MAELYLISTPIGNLADITMRAIDTLRRVDFVFAEDTRRTRILLDHYHLGADLRSLHAHNEAARTELVLTHLDSGAAVALVSDAGTPLVSDPGARLVRGAVERGHRVIPIPGPSAVLAALSGAGLPTEAFAFLGFVPRKGVERQSTLERVRSSAETTLVFEAPGRLIRLLEDLVTVCGDEREAVVARELTKLHEEFQRGSLAELILHYREKPPRGEITVLVAPAPSKGVEEGEVQEEAARLLAEGLSPSRAASVLSGQLGIARNHAYRVLQSLAAPRDP